jgi:hypothetical protein
MGYLLTIEGLCQDVEVVSFGFDRNGTVWNIVLPLTDRAPTIMQAASEGRIFDRATLTGAAMPLALVSVAIASCSAPGEYLDVSLDGTPE